VVMTAVAAVALRAETPLRRLISSRLAPQCKTARFVRRRVHLWIGPVWWDLGSPSDAVPYHFLQLPWRDWLLLSPLVVARFLSTSPPVALLPLLGRRSVAPVAAAPAVASRGRLRLLPFRYGQSRGWWGEGAAGGRRGRQWVALVALAMAAMAGERARAAALTAATAVARQQWQQQRQQAAACDGCDGERASGDAAAAEEEEGGSDCAVAPAPTWGGGRYARSPLRRAAASRLGFAAAAWAIRCPAASSARNQGERSGAAAVLVPCAAAECVAALSSAQLAGRRWWKRLRGGRWWLARRALRGASLVQYSTVAALRWSAAQGRPRPWNGGRGERGAAASAGGHSSPPRATQRTQLSPLGDAGRREALPGVCSTGSGRVAAPVAVLRRRVLRLRRRVLRLRLCCMAAVVRCAAAASAAAGRRWQRGPVLRPWHAPRAATPSGPAAAAAAAERGSGEQCESGAACARGGGGGP
jgi:hypothetical protein